MIPVSGQKIEIVGEYANASGGCGNAAVGQRSCNVKNTSTNEASGKTFPERPMQYKGQHQQHKVQVPRNKEKPRPPVA